VHVVKFVRHLLGVPLRGEERQVAALDGRHVLLAITAETKGGFLGLCAVCMCVCVCVLCCAVSGFWAILEPASGWFKRSAARLSSEVLRMSNVLLSAG
jgi:hypothetical protein